MYRHHPTWVEVTRLVRTGAIGHLQGIQTWFSYFNDDPANIRNQIEPRRRRPDGHRLLPDQPVPDALPGRTDGGRRPGPT